MSRLILPNDANSIVTKDIILATQLPAKTDSYSPVPHKVVIETILETLDKAGLTLLTEDYSMARGGLQARGRFTFSGGDSEMAPSLIFHNSYNKTLPLRAALGTKVIVCDNGMVMGDMGAFKRKHTGNILNEFIEQITRHIMDAGKTFDELKRQRERMKEIEISKRVQAELIGRLYIEESLVKSEQLSILKREIENPSYNYGIEGTIWNTYNAVTVALKESNPTMYLQQHQDLHKFIQTEYELVS